MKLKRLIILPLVALIFSTINVLPAYAALGDDWDATASGLRESINVWKSSKISSNGSTQVAVVENSIYVSTDSGNTWTNKYTLTGKSIFDVELSDDGIYLRKDSKDLSRKYTYNMDEEPTEEKDKMKTRRRSKYSQIFNDPIDDESEEKFKSALKDPNRNNLQDLKKDKRFSLYQYSNFR